jgi:hypothetical protein
MPLLIDKQSGRTLWFDEAKVLILWTKTDIFTAVIKLARRNLFLIAEKLHWNSVFYLTGISFEFKQFELIIVWAKCQICTIREQLA